MQENKHGPKFWLGNGLLGLSLLVLLFMDALAQQMGLWAMALWMILAGIGMYFVMEDSKGRSGTPD